MQYAESWHVSVFLETKPYCHNSLIILVILHATRWEDLSTGKQWRWLQVEYLCNHSLLEV